MENEREERDVSRGIIYVMTTVVPGLVKIGKTGSSNFEQRMYGLERNGYFNVAGLRRRFAIEVEDYDEKEALLDEIFSKSRVPYSELFAPDVDLVIQLLSSLEGRQVYPERESKEDSFDQATEERRVKDDWSRIPDGAYHMERKTKGGTARATMIASGGDFTVKAGAECLRSKEGGLASRAKEGREDRRRRAPGGRHVQGAVHGKLGRARSRQQRLEDRGRLFHRQVPPEGREVAEQYDSLNSTPIQRSRSDKTSGEFHAGPHIADSCSWLLRLPGHVTGNWTRRICHRVPYRSHSQESVSIPLLHRAL